ncbi:hypothetical protein C8R42DRAFT_397138 [Lentinula raphanica]|nr:hypothetical protein C8R42DRAFT_397138 [Lentinula raphanica]
MRIMFMSLKISASLPALSQILWMGTGFCSRAFSFRNWNFKKVDHWILFQGIMHHGLLSSSHFPSLSVTNRPTNSECLATSKSLKSRWMENLTSRKDSCREPQKAAAWYRRVPENGSLAIGPAHSSRHTPASDIDNKSLIIHPSGWRISTYVLSPQALLNV